MANVATFKTSERKYTACLGVVEFDLGNPVVHYKRAVIAHFKEEKTITRALTAIATDNDSLTMATYDFWYGGLTDGYTHVYFDYESEKITSECHRVSEAGFFEKTTVKTTCTGITVQ